MNFGLRGESTPFALMTAILLVGSGSAAHAAAYSFQWLGKLSGDNTSYAYAISDDGSTVVGASYTDPNSPTAVIRAFRWTAATGMVAIGDLPGGNQQSEALGVSADGSVIAGSSSSTLSYSHNSFYDEPFRWTASSGMKALGYLPGTNGRYGGAGPVSGNGLVIGGSSTGDNGTKPFLWSAATGMVDIDTLGHGQGNQDAVFEINYDGSMAVGMTTYDNDRRAFLWTAGSGMQLLGALPGTPSNRLESWAEDLSANGSVVVGQAYSATSIVPFRWTASGGMAPLPMLPGAALGNAFGVSADGSIIVGYNILGSTDHALRWDPILGPQSIEDILRAHGFSSVLNGNMLTKAIGISADGQTIMGWGYGPSGIQSWVATIPVPEPSTIVLAFLGGVIVFGSCRPK